MVVNKTALSAGEVIRHILTEDDEVKRLTRDVFPIVSEEDATLPYVVYRRSGMADTTVKGGASADTVYIEILCYTEHYAESVELAEAVRNALENSEYQSENFRMRKCYLTDSEENYAGDAYEQRLTFTIKI